MLEGPRGETAIAVLRRHEGIPADMCCRWGEGLDRGRQTQVGDTERQLDARQVAVIRVRQLESVRVGRLHACIG